MKAYVNAQNPKTIYEVIHHAIVAQKIFASSKGMPKQGDHQEKTHEKDRAMWDAKPFGNKDSRPNDGKKKDKNGYKGQNPLTCKVMEKYCKDKCCFYCGEQGHNYCGCPKILHKLHLFYP